MKPKNHDRGLTIIKLFIISVITTISIFFIRYVNYVLDWIELSSGSIDGPLLWICVIYGLGFCGGITSTWIAWKPDVTTLSKRVTTPTLVNHALYTICMIIKLKKWEKYVNFNQLYELQKKK